MFHFYCSFLAEIFLHACDTQLGAVPILWLRCVVLLSILNEAHMTQAQEYERAPAEVEQATVERCL